MQFFGRTVICDASLLFGGDEGSKRSREIFGSSRHTGCSSRRVADRRDGGLHSNLAPLELAQGTPLRLDVKLGVKLIVKSVSNPVHSSYILLGGAHL
jgi:hypothetical protein